MHVIRNFAVFAIIAICASGCSAIFSKKTAFLDVSVAAEEGERALIIERVHEFIGSELIPLGYKDVTDTTLSALARLDLKASQTETHYVWIKAEGDGPSQIRDYHMGCTLALVHEVVLIRFWQAGRSEMSDCQPREIAKSLATTLATLFPKAVIDMRSATDVDWIIAP